MQPIKNIVQLRQFLAERLPSFRPAPTMVRAVRSVPDGSSPLENLFRALLSKGSVTEVVSASRSAGSALLIHWLLRRTHNLGQCLVLVDGQDCFDPVCLEQETFSRLLWVRCHDANEALKATDFLLRDDNLPLVLLDLQMDPVVQLQKIPPTVWYRFQRLIEHRSTTLLVSTPQTLVNGARGRILLRNTFGLEALHKSEEELAAQFQFEITRMDGKEITISEPSVKTA